MTEDAKKKQKGVWTTEAQVRLTGSPDIARFLAQCVYWSKLEMVKKRQGWFYKSRDQWKSETWLSRYKQEKARKKLKDLFILQERRERTNLGITIWFRINTGLLNHLLNTLDKQPVLESPVIDLNVQPEKQVNKVIKVIKKESVLTKTENQIPSRARPRGVKNGTYVPESQSFSLNPEDYTFCHVFVYQFVKTRLPHLNARERLLWQVYGLDDHDLFNRFSLFVEHNGSTMIDWYRENVSVDVSGFTVDDYQFAQIAGRRIYAST